MLKRLLCTVLSIYSLTSHAQITWPPSPIPEEREYFSTSQLAANFTAVYATQWIYYVTFQEFAIKDHGSVDNWLQYPFKPHFDRDNFDYNIFKHTLTGNYYYLWYRSRGYDENRAFVWSFISSLAFEFTVETYTEKPSWQDIYQTPVFGAVAGIGSEKLARYFHSWENWYGHALGYLFNPFTLIPQQEKATDTSLSIYPMTNGKLWGANVSYQF